MESCREHCSGIFPIEGTEAREIVDVEVHGAARKAEVGIDQCKERTQELGGHNLGLPLFEQAKSRRVWGNIEDPPRRRSGSESKAMNATRPSRPSGDKSPHEASVRTVRAGEVVGHRGTERQRGTSRRKI